MSEQAASAPDFKLYLRLVGLGVVIGVPAALVAALFLAVVHDLEGWLWDGDSTAWYLVIGLPAVGACIVYLARRFLPGDGGNRPIEGIGHGPARVRDAPGIALAASEPAERSGSQLAETTGGQLLRLQDQVG